MSERVTDRATERGSETAAVLARLLRGDDLERETVEALFGRIMDGELSEAEMAGVLVALAAKGEAVDEIAGAAAAMRARVVRVPHSRADAIDTCGTGGDGRGTFNVSTAAAFVAAAAGAPVAKHGNRAISSRSGSADVLAALGVEVGVEPGRAGRQLDELGVAFLFAPAHHPAMKAVAPVRKALGVRTLFNLLGPLTNPAAARRQLLGVYARDRVEPVARVLSGLGCDHAWVVHGDDGLDEITTTTTTFVAELRNGEVRTFTLDPASLGVPRADPAQLVGGSPADNAERLVRVLEGQGGAVARLAALTEIVALNAGAAIYVAGRARSIAEGVEQAREILASGSALAKLEALKSFQ